MKTYGWSYDYLLWGISWLNVQMILADALRVDNDHKDNDGESESVKLERKEDIKNFFKRMM